MDHSVRNSLVFKTATLENRVPERKKMRFVKYYTELLDLIIPATKYVLEYWLIIVELN